MEKKTPTVIVEDMTSSPITLTVAEILVEDMTSSPKIRLQGEEDATILVEEIINPKIGVVEKKTPTVIVEDMTSSPITLTVAEILVEDMTSSPKIRLQEGEEVQTSFVGDTQSGPKTWLVRPAPALYVWCSGPD